MTTPLISTILPCDTARWHVTPGEESRGERGRPAGCEADARASRSYRRRALGTRSNRARCRSMSVATRASWSYGQQCDGDGEASIRPTVREPGSRYSGSARAGGSGDRPEGPTPSRSRRPPPSCRPAWRRSRLVSASDDGARERRCRRVDAPWSSPHGDDRAERRPRRLAATPTSGRRSRRSCAGVAANAITSGDPRAARRAWRRDPLTSPRARTGRAALQVRPQRAAARASTTRRPAASATQDRARSQARGIPLKRHRSCANPLHETIAYRQAP